MRSADENHWVEDFPSSPPPLPPPPYHALLTQPHTTTCKSWRLSAVSSRDVIVFMTPSGWILTNPLSLYWETLKATTPKQFSTSASFSSVGLCKEYLIFRSSLNSFFPIFVFCCFILKSLKPWMFLVSNNL